MKSFLATLALLVSINSYSFDELPAPSEEYLKEVTQICKQYAIDDQVEDKDFKTYVLDCVNEDLEANGYAKVTMEDLDLDD